MLDQVGFVQSIIVNRSSGFVVDGHARVALAISKHQPSVPVVYVELEDAEERMVLATLDPLSALATSDADQLAALLDGLEPADAAVRSLLADLAPPVKKQLNPDDADLTPPDEPVTKPGDLWLLGEHRLLCGDATRVEDVGRLVDAISVTLMLADPPYNAGFDYGEHVDDNRDDYPQWCMSWFEPNVRLAKRTILTVGESNLGLWLQCAPWRQHIGAWIKGSSAVAHSKVTQFVGWEPILFYGQDKWPRTRHLDVFNFEAGAVPRLDHPCPKPVALWRELIECCTVTGDLVLDLFGGSGTTLIAAEESLRRGCLLEIEPAYCDVIVRRWERVSGRQAHKENA